MPVTKRRAIGSRELLAIDPRAIQRDADGIFLLFGPGVPDNEQVSDASIVHVRGPLDHHRGFGDCYDDIRDRMRCAFEDEDTDRVIARIDSPGGVVAGLLDTVRCIRELSEGSGKRSIAYVDENSFSAAYALSCAFDEIVLPPSAITGSIGVISTMGDQVDKDLADGYNFVTLTSGARKADGHPHVRITDAMLTAEQRRVDKLALQFFRMVRASRGLSVATVRSFQARLFLGTEAVAAGVADRVATFDQIVAELAQNGTSLAKRGTTGTSKAHGPVEDGTLKEVDMNARGALLEELKAAKAALAKSSAAQKPAAQALVTGLSAALDAYKKVTEKHVEHSKTHEEDEGDEDEGAEGNETDRSDDPEDDESEDKDDKKASAAPTKKSAASTKKAMNDEEDASSEEDEAEALAAQVRRATGGKRGAAAQGALAGLVAKAQSADQLAARIEKLERERAAEARETRIEGALAAHRITKKEATILRGKPMAYVEAFLEARPKSLIASSDEELLTPAALAGGHAKLPPEMEKVLAQAMAVAGDVGAKGATREQFLSDYAKANGVNKAGSL